MMNTGYQQSTVVFCVSKHTRQPLDVDGKLCSETGRKQAVLLLEGYPNPNPDLYEEAGTFAWGESLDGVATRRLNTMSCPVDIPPPVKPTLPPYVKEPIKEIYFVYNDAGHNWLGAHDWDGVSTTYPATAGRWNRFTAKIRRVGEHEWLLGNVPAHVTSGDTNVKKYELTQHIVDAQFYETITMQEVELMDGIHSPSDGNFVQYINLLSTDNRQVIDPVIDKQASFNRFRSKDIINAGVELISEDPSNGKKVFKLLGSSTQKGIGSNGNVYYGQRDFTLSANNTEEGRNLLLGLKIYYNGTINSDPDIIPEIGEEFNYERIFSDSDIIEDGSRLRVKVPFFSDWETARFFQLPDGVGYEQLSGSKIEFVLEQGDVTNTLYAPNYSDYLFDRNWGYARLADFMQIIGMTGSLKADDVIKSIFSSADDTEFPYGGRNAGNDELGSRLTLSGARDNGQGYNYLWQGLLGHYHAFPEDLSQWSGKPKLRFTTDGELFAGYKIAYEHDYFSEEDGSPYESGVWKMANHRFCRRLTDLELGYKLYRDDAKDMISVISHTASAPADPAKVGLTEADELPKGALRGLAVRWMNKGKTEVLTSLSSLLQEIEKVKTDPEYGWFGFNDERLGL